MPWVKKGRIFTTDGSPPWMAHHASIPTVDCISETRLRIYFGPRDSQGRTLTGFIDVDPAVPTTILRVSDQPALGLGALGCFDDDGAMPSCVVNMPDHKRLYYIGWNRGVTVPYRNSIGVAASTDGGVTFTRMFDGPILERSAREPHFTATPYVLFDEGRWRMWYTATTEWLEIQGRVEPRYCIRYAESEDGLEWQPGYRTCIPYADASEANSRPTVLRDGDLYRMWYCYRSVHGYRVRSSGSYRIGYAESHDGTSWSRHDDRVGIELSETGWDSEMMAYPCVYRHGGKLFMLYVGNGFGRDGFGYAVWE